MEENQYASHPSFMILLHFLLYAQKKRSKRKRHHGRKPISPLNAQPLPAEKCLNQFEHAELTPIATFLKAGQPHGLNVFTPTVDHPPHRFGSLLKSLLPKNLLN